MGVLTEERGSTAASLATPKRVQDRTFSHWAPQPVCLPHVGLGGHQLCPSLGLGSRPESLRAALSPLFCIHPEPCPPLSPSPFHTAPIPHGGTLSDWAVPLGSPRHGTYRPAFRPGSPGERARAAATGAASSPGPPGPGPAPGPAARGRRRAARAAAAPPRPGRRPPRLPTPAAAARSRAPGCSALGLAERTGREGRGHREGRNDQGGG